MPFLSWLADRLILCPSTNPLDPDGKRRELIATSDGDIESWIGQFPNHASEFDVVVVKFPGTGGRAERSGVHPTEIWAEFNCEIWSVNPKGYGGSSGPASIKYFPNTAESVIEHVFAKRPGVPVVVIGNSLGCVSALFVAALGGVSAVMLRNPPPLHQMIRSRPRYAGWNFGMSRMIAAQVPNDLDAIKNASGCTAPCLFIQSEQDRVVPTNYQDLIISAYSGPKRVFSIYGADHHELVEEPQQQEYFEAVRWLGESIFANNCREN